MMKSNREKHMHERKEMKNQRNTDGYENRC